MLAFLELVPCIGIFSFSTFFGAPMPLPRTNVGVPPLFIAGTADVSTVHTRVRCNISCWFASVWISNCSFNSAPPSPEPMKIFCTTYVGSEGELLDWPANPFFSSVKPFAVNETIAFFTIAKGFGASFASTTRIWQHRLKLDWRAPRVESIIVFYGPALLALRSCFVLFP